MALGNWQEYGIDYEKRFTFVAKMTIVYTVTTIVIFKGWSFCKMHFYMVTWKKKSLCLLLLVFFLLLLLRFIVWNGLYMVWSRHHMYGLRSFILLCWVLHLLKINMTSLYFFTKLPLGPLYFLCVSMMLWLLDII